MRRVTDRSFMQVLCLGSSLTLLVLLGVCGSAGAVMPGPAWSVQSIAGPTNFIPGDEERHALAYQVFVTNVGSQATDGSPVTITDTLPQGVESYRLELYDYKADEGSDPIDRECGDPCTYSAVVPAGDILQLVIYVSVPASAPEGSITKNVTGAGGGATPVSVSALNAICRTPAPFAIKDFGFGVTGLNGAPDTQAGSHPYAVSTSLDFTTEVVGGKEFTPSRAVKDVVTDLPLGFAGSALAAPRCPLSDLVGGYSGFGSRADTRIGNVTLHTNLNTTPQSSVTDDAFPLSPVYNMVPERGHPAEFGFDIGEFYAVHLFASVVHTPAGFVLRVTSPDNPSLFANPKQKGGNLAGITLTLFGDPEAEDGGASTEVNNHGFPVSAGNLPVPYYTNPTDCSGEPLAAMVHVDTWTQQGRIHADGEPDFSDPNWLEAKSMLPATTGCDLWQFRPSFRAAPETTQPDSPTGSATHLEVPQAPNDDFSLASPDLKSVSVALPAGLALSPSAAGGLQACSDAQFAEESTQPAACPEASQIGTAGAHPPALGE